jgi:2-polyprenyl-3-methyl-5-hydroxy-6-metoxy-1,4-benzoquinol methylase
MPVIASAWVLSFMALREHLRMADGRSSTVLNPQSWPVVHDRTEYLKRLAQGLDVLEIGCTGRKGSGRLPDCASTLHHGIRPVCASLTGLDIDAEGIEVMKKAGYHAVFGDVSSASLNQKFDLIIAAEVIEHLPNPALALCNLKAHLKNSGTLVVTTCNPFYYRQQSRIVRHGGIQVNAAHTCWYDPLTLARMLRSAGFAVAKGAWISPKKRWNPMTFMARWRKYWNPNFLVEVKPEEQ